MDFTDFIFHKECSDAVNV